LGEEKVVRQDQQVEKAISEEEKNKDIKEEKKVAVS